jgi:hypothetical protein
LTTLNAIDPLPHNSAYRVQRSAQGLTLEFAPLRAAAPALGLLAFALLCALMPALGLAALLPLDTANAAAWLSLALIGGFAAPFILASIVFAVLAVYLLANSLHVEVGADGARTVRRVFGHVIRRCEIARAAIADVEPRTSARYQNLFSSTPRYALVARHTSERGKDVVVAEDLAGQPQMAQLRTLLCTTWNIN